MANLAWPGKGQIWHLCRYRTYICKIYKKNTYKGSWYLIAECACVDPPPWVGAGPDFLSSVSALLMATHIRVPLCHLNKSGHQIYFCALSGLYYADSLILLLHFIVLKVFLIILVTWKWWNCIAARVTPASCWDLCWRPGYSSMALGLSAYSAFMNWWAFCPYNPFKLIGLLFLKYCCCPS